MKIASHQTEEREKCILLVEDHLESLQALETFLRLKGHSVHTARNGEDGLQLFKGGDYAAVVSDLYMPIMSGEEMTLEIRRLQSDVPVVLMTTTPEGVHEPKMFSAVFRKPFDFPELERLLAKLTRT